MAFEPLNTDEKLDGPTPKAPDMDSQMLFGCSGFLVASLGGYALAVWPFFLFQESQRLGVLGISCAAGLVPAAVLAAVASRKFAVAGACGAVGGSLATAMFLYLRLNQIFLAWMARRVSQPEYPAMIQWLLPVAWVLLVLLVALTFTPHEPKEA